MSYHIVSIDSPQCSISCRDGQLTCKTAEGERTLPLEDIASIIITSFSATLHSHLFLEAAKHGVALILCEAFKPVSLVLPANRSTDTLLSRAQIALPERTRRELWHKTVDAKCRNQWLLAEHIAPGDARLAGLCATAQGRKPHKEAVCARIFWQIFGSALDCAEFRRDPAGSHSPAPYTGPAAANRQEADQGRGSAWESGSSLPLPAHPPPEKSGRRVRHSKASPSSGVPVLPAAPPGRESPAKAELLLTDQQARGRLNDLLNYGYAVLLSSVLQKLFGVGLDPTFGISHAPRERSTPLAYDLMEPFRPCVDWRVFQWARQHPNRTEWTVSRQYRQWVTGFVLERVEYLDFTLEIQGIIEGVVRGFRRAVLEHAVRYYRPWTPRSTKWAGSW